MENLNQQQKEQLDKILILARRYTCPKPINVEKKIKEIKGHWEKFFR